VPRAELTGLSLFFGLGTSVQAIPRPAPAGSLRHRLGIVAGCALLALGLGGHRPPPHGMMSP
jgi:hypothetical protein